MSRSMQLEAVKGIGPSAAKKLRAAGVETIEDLIALDQRSVSVPGLDQKHVATLRENARRLVEAANGGGLTLVDGLGPSAARKLKRAGVETIEDLVALDLRSQEVPGLSTENLQKLKRNANYLHLDEA